MGKGWGNKNRGWWWGRGNQVGGEGENEGGGARGWGEEVVEWW